MDTEQQATLPEERTLREELAANLEALSVPETVETAAPAETDAQKTERLRDEAGRFAAKEPATKADTNLQQSTRDRSYVRKGRVN